MNHLKGKTLFITGASRGIGKAIALRAASDGANIVIVAKTSEPNPKLEGTIFSAAKDIEKAGGKALPIQTDIRDEMQIQAAVQKAVETFGGIDILVNNASAITLAGTLETPSKRYDLMQQINTRGAFLCSQHCIPHLKKSQNPHILNMSPPINLNPKWFKNNTAYTISKYGMSMCVLGMSAEFANDGIAVNALWPRTLILTAALALIGNAQEVAKHCRKPEIVADAAHYIFTQEAKTTTGNFFIDEEVLKKSGVTDFKKYAVDPDSQLQTDFFLEN